MSSFSVTCVQMCLGLRLRIVLFIREYPGRKLILPLSADIDFLKLIIQGLGPITLSHLHWHANWNFHSVSLAQATILLRFHGYFSVMNRRHSFAAAVLVLWLLQSFRFFFSFMVFPKPWVQELCCRKTTWARHSTFTYCLHVDQLWISLTRVSICCKK